jgi:hypothetical protein
VIIDCFIHSYEREAVKVRLAELRDVVDFHVAVQATTSFRYQTRETPWVEDQRVINIVVSLPAGLTPWEAEWFLRDASFTLAAEWATAHYPDEDPRFIISDGDEIPHPDAVRHAAGSPGPRVMLTDYREWFIDWRAPDRWQLEHQPIIATAEQIRQQGGATEARRRCREWSLTTPVGWHLSTLGGADLAGRKLSSFAHSEYDTPEWNDGAQLAWYRATRRDLLGRFVLDHTGDLPACAEAFPHLLSRSA